MKKPAGKADPGWYDAPEFEGYLQWWNGKYWDDRLIPNNEATPTPELPAFELGRFFFRKPYFGDGAFNLFFGINLFFALSRLVVNLNEGSLNASNSFSVVSGLLDATIGTALIAFIIWIPFLVYLYPRRKRDKKRL